MMMKTDTFSAAVLIPSYNTGERLASTVSSALAVWPDVLVVIDGSTDGSEQALESLRAEHSGLRLQRMARNSGKGAAVKAGVDTLLAAGFSHVLTMDADGQHPASSIRPLLEAARSAPDTLIMGRPVFGSDVPKERLYGRRLNLFWTDFETFFCGLGDTLFGMRVYPLRPLRKVFEETDYARGFDFDPEVAVRLCWAGHRPLQVDVPVRYFTVDEGGVSHFHYVRDNVKLTGMHARLMWEFLFRRRPQMLQWKRRWRNLAE